MTFNHSNTNWTSVSGGYVPTENRIGSNNSVGTVSKKFEFTFNNQTNKNYKLITDFSSTSSSNSITTLYNNVPVGTNGNNTDSYWNPLLETFYLPSFTNFIFHVNAGSFAHYFDAWYLEDLGVSDSYNNGFDLGQTQGYSDGYSDGLNNNPNILLNGFQAMVGILVNFVLMIVNLEVFGVSIMGIFSIVVLFTGIVWVLKLIRG
jgi:hypothetical protein